MIELKTKEDYVKAHRLLWDWLAKHPDMEKCHWPGWRGNGGVYKFAVSYCFACEWGGEKGCHGCLLVWPDRGFCNVYNEDLFLLWSTEANPTKRAALARQIRDLPVREEQHQNQQARRNQKMASASKKKWPRRVLIRRGRTGGRRANG
jgi:hypothetical protein